MLGSTYLKTKKENRLRLSSLKDLSPNSYLATSSFCIPEYTGLSFITYKMNYNNSAGLGCLGGSEG